MEAVMRMIHQQELYGAEEEMTQFKAMASRSVDEVDEMEPEDEE